MNYKLFKYMLYTLLLGTILGCNNKKHSLEGIYRGVLQSKGGELAFKLEIEKTNTGWRGYVQNDTEKIYFDSIEWAENQLYLNFNYLDSHLDATMGTDGNLYGEWHKRTSNNKRNRLPFVAEKGDKPRYAITKPNTQPFDGEWQVTFQRQNGTTYPAQGIFKSQKNGKLYATFATETGDYRYLEGVYTDNSFTLSTFDAAHAYLFKGQLEEDNTIIGKFWSSENDPYTFKGIKGTSLLRNPENINTDVIGNTIRFAFPDVKGNIITSDEPKYKNKPMVLYLFGSWCPNCADETVLLKELYEQYKNVNFVGLGFEYTGDFNLDAPMIEHYKKRFDIPWTLLVGGSSDKTIASKNLSFIDDITSFPTCFFIDKDHTIRYVHTGFNGPATGELYEKERQLYYKYIKEINE